MSFFACQYCILYCTYINKLKKKVTLVGVVGLVTVVGVVTAVGEVVVVGAPTNKSNCGDPQKLERPCQLNITLLISASC